ncbi:MAG TPA: efflux transporter outer membrane subunit [Bryobacteraceae bacterium]|nr:efflux transporter outer membrane subunit [Bryobacteraceae bacterium]
MRRTISSLTAASILLLCGCVKGPNYSRPKVDVPAAYHGPAQSAAAASQESLGNAKWWTVFRDEELQKLIRIALQQNFDLRMAANRVLQARELVTIARSNQYPTVTGGVMVSGTRAPGTNGGPATSYTGPEIGFSGSWDIDFWGKYRRLTEAARAELMGTEWARRTVVNSLISGIAAAYFDLRELDLELEISRRTLASREDSLKIIRTLVDGGAAPLSDQRQAEQLVETAASAIPDLERAVAQQENAINILLARNPGEVITRGLTLADQPIPAEPPAGIPSTLLERRPDIAEAEQNLIAANARIGAARAEFFPQISLTGIGGIASGALTTLFRGTSRAWSYTGSAMQPIFNKGRLDANLRLAEAQREQALLAYQQSIQQSFRDVSDALIAYQKLHEFRVHQERLLAAAREASQLSRTRYQAGATSYLEVLTNETNNYAAEVGVAGAILRERLTLVQLYNALGGGWEL